MMVNMKLCVEVPPMLAACNFVNACSRFDGAVGE